MTYEDKIRFAIKLIQSIPQDGPVELCYSGGKDSDVILELAKMSRIPFDPIYKQTSIDPPGTTKHVMEMGVRIVRPKIPFFKLVEKKGNPSRFKRFCCEELKEYKIHDRAIVGIRRSESYRRAKRYTEPEICRVYHNKQKVRQYFPILEWTDEDVERFIAERGIKCAPVYYDEAGKFHVERRLGCVACPLKSDNGLSDYKKYPLFLKAQVKAYQKFLDNHRESNWWKRINGDACNAFYYFLFCKSDAEYQQKMGVGQLFEGERLSTKEFLENYFGVELD